MTEADPVFTAWQTGGYTGVLTDPTAFATAAQGALAATALQSETDPVFAAWLLATPPVMTEADPVFTAWQTGGYTGVLTDPTAFATAAQGALADTAVQGTPWTSAGYLTDISGQDLATADNTTSAFITAAAIPTALSAFTNDSGFITSSALGEWNSVLYPTDAAGVLTNDGSGNLSWGAAGGSATWAAITGTQTDVNVGGFTNDAGYVTGTPWNGTTLTDGSYASVDLYNRGLFWASDGSNPVLNWSNSTLNQHWDGSGAGPTLDWQNRYLYGTWTDGLGNSILTSATAFVPTGTVAYAGDNVSGFTNDAGYLTPNGDGSGLTGCVDSRFVSATPSTSIGGVVIPSSFSTGGGLYFGVGDGNGSDTIALFNYAGNNYLSAGNLPLIISAPTGGISFQGTVDGSTITGVVVSLSGHNVSELTNDAGFYVGDGSAFATAAQGALADTALQSETDPVFSAWNKSTGITITESQISDLQSYLINGYQAGPVTLGLLASPVAVDAPDLTIRGADADGAHTGLVTIRGGDITNVGYAGGAVEIVGGNSTSGVAGSVTLRPGTASGGGQNGYIILDASTGFPSCVQILGALTGDQLCGMDTYASISLQSRALTTGSGTVATWVDGTLKDSSGNAFVIGAPWQSEGYLIASSGDFATAAQGTLANSALQSLSGHSVSELSNDTGFIGDAPFDGNVYVRYAGDWYQQTSVLSSFTNDMGYLTSAWSPSGTVAYHGDNVSEFTNDAGYLTSISGLYADAVFSLSGHSVSELTNDAGYITSASIPTNVSSFTNDAGYLTSETDPDFSAWAAALALESLVPDNYLYLDGSGAVHCRQLTFGYNDATSPSAWSGTPPTSVNDAINRIAAAVAGLLGTPIP